MKTVLVTGGCGFIGSNLVDLLRDREYNVIVVDNLSSGKKEHCRDDVEYHFHDFQDLLASGAFSTQKIDVIFHLAAEARIQPSFENPLYTCENNSLGTAIVCEYARTHGCKVVYAGSSSFYGGVYLNPYSFAKWQGEEVCRMYSDVYGVNTAIMRFFNVYGPRNPLIGQYTPVVAIFENQKRTSGALTIVGDGEQRRDFTHVKDICRGLELASRGEWLAEIFNLGTGTNYSINELAEMFEHEVKYIPARPGEARNTLADITKTTEFLGWKPTQDIREYIKNT
jgi:nucleoside-diphosphate-sugar epimerase|tara:strand:- start:831 stop:1676 length:846 start_codon:yes stop_codon:yes gene_type:complete